MTTREEIEEFIPRIISQAPKDEAKLFRLILTALKELLEAQRK